MGSLIDIDAAKRVAQQARDAAIETAQKQYSSDMAAIEQLSGLGKRFANALPAATNGTALWPGLSRAIAGFAEKQPSPFNVNDLLEYIEKRYNRAINKGSISTELWRMAKENEIAVHLPGSGRRPTQYQKIGGAKSVEMKAGQAASNKIALATPA